MNILFVCNEYPPGAHGGIGTVTQVLARGLKARGHGVVVAGYYPDVASNLQVLEDDGIPVYRLRQSRGACKSVRSILRLYVLVRKLIKQYSSQVLEAPDYFGLLAFWPPLPIPVVVRIHGSDAYFSVEMGRRVCRRVYLRERWTLKKAAMLVGVSRYAADKTMRIFGLSAPVEIIYNSIDMALQPAVEAGAADPFKVVFTGTVMRKKGVFSLLEAWPEVVAEIPQARLHVFGRDCMDESGVSTLSLLQEKMALPLKPTVTFHGHCSRSVLRKELSGAAAAVFPSFSETFGLGPVEAMACGCPTIYTRLSCGPEIIRNDVDGILIDPAQPREIAGAIIKLLTDRACASRLGAQGRMTVLSRFSEENIILQNERLFAGLL